MAKKTKDVSLEQEPATLRRSSRSTRGSVKPMVDLAKQEQDPEIADENAVEEEDDDFRVGQAERGSARKSSGPKRESIKRDPVKRTTAKKTKVKGEASEPVKSEHIEGSAEDDNDLAAPGDGNDKYYELSEMELKDINHAFDMNRINDEEEALNVDGLRTAIRSLGFEPRGDEIKKLMKSFGKRGNKVNRDGFHKIMALKFGSSPGTKLNNLNDEISRVFNLLDLDKTGLITIENLKSIAKELNEDLTEDELREMISEADLDGDSMINKQEFQNIMVKTSLY